MTSRYGVHVAGANAPAMSTDNLAQAFLWVLEQRRIYGNHQPMTVVGYQARLTCTKPDRRRNYRTRRNRNNG